MESYPEIYQKYVKYAEMVGSPVWTYTEWLEKRDAPPPSRFEQTQKFLIEYGINERKTKLRKL